MIVLGLTGSIAMGKSRAGAMFRAFGVPVFDADAEVHQLFAAGGAAVGPVAGAFPGSLGSDGGIDRGRLGQLVLGRADELRRLERIVHPLVRQAEGGFLRRACRAGSELVVLDVPLLLETGGQERVDAVAVVWANPMLQMQRALRRPGMTVRKLAQVRAAQLPDQEKRKRADFLIPSGYDRGATARNIRAVIEAASKLRPRAWPDRWATRALSHAGR
ncbi:MAG: dephospho-CoA kinase [Geminicoccaceae bacterium]